MRQALMVGLLALAGCASVEVGEYRDERPALDLRRYFNGPLDAWGMFQDRRGKVLKRFHVRIEGRWEGDTGTLDEHFTYADGSTQRRVWTLQRQADGSYRGHAADVIGEARGEVEIHFPKRFSCLLKALRLLPAGLYFRPIRRATGL